MRHNKRMLERASRKIERERKKIEAQEQKQIKEIQKLAKLGQHVSDWFECGSDEFVFSIKIYTIIFGNRMYKGLSNCMTKSIFSDIERSKDHF